MLEVGIVHMYVFYVFVLQFDNLMDDVSSQTVV